MSTDDVRKATEAKLQQLAPAIAKALGGWYTSSEHRHQVTLSHPKDASQLVGISASYPDAQKGRVSIGGVLPMRTRHGETVSAHGVKVPRITVAIERGAEAIAAEITRRFLPAYLAALGEMRSRIASCEASRDQTDQLAGRLARLCGGVEVDDRGRFHLPDEFASYGTVQSQGDRVRIEATFSPEQAEAVLKALAVLAWKGASR